MNEIKRTEANESKIIYEMKATGNFADVKIEICAESGGYGCLYDITLPRMAIKGSCWSGDSKDPEMGDVLHVLNHIFKEFNCSERIVNNLKSVSVL